MFAFAGIDGTGPWSNATYEKNFAKSHVKTLYTLWPWPKLAYYSRGPEITGFATGMLAQNAYGFVMECVKKKGAKGIFLAGFSRGGAAVIETASYLNGFFWNNNVDCLILFDAVDRSTTVGGLIFDTSIKKNVKICLHAMRDPKAESRESFGNCGQRISDPSSTLLVSKKFVCTHGGVGGTPWVGGKPKELIDEGGMDGKTAITYEQDEIVSHDVWKWMKPKVDAAIKLAGHK